MQKVLARLRPDTGGVAMVEFALISPILLLMGLGGIELANLAIVKTRVNQTAMHIADNASRIGDTDALSAQRIYEGDVNDLFIGAAHQAGDGVNIFEHGRAVVSSLERNADGGQWIHWQRCMGLKNFASKYGGEGTGATGTGFTGMGEPGQELKAEERQAIMYVEVSYDYQPVVASQFASRFVDGFEIKSSAAFHVRGTRDLGGIYQRATPSPKSTCDKYQTAP